MQPRWHIQVKQLKAVYTTEIGKKYSGVCHINIMGDIAYIDGLLTTQKLTKRDFLQLKQELAAYGVKSIVSHRIKNDQLTLKYY